MKRFIYLLLALCVVTFSALGQESKVRQHIQEGIKLHDSGEYKKAIDEYKKALKVDPKNPGVHYEIASSYFAMKNYKKAIEYSDNVIGSKSEFVDMAYIVKGSALDLLGKPKDAIKSYKKGIKENPDSYMLHYNLALTYFNQEDDKNAEESCMKAIELNRSHPTSHLLLGSIMHAKNKRVQTLLAYYHFLMLEPTSERAKGVYAALVELQQKGVSKEDNNTTVINISMPDKKDGDEFSAAELMISMLEASKSLEENEGKSEEVLFYENTESFFTILGELKDKQKSFWWETYVDFFYAMVNAKHTEAFCYYISLAKEDTEEVTDWLEDNEDKIEEFSNWYDNLN